LAVGVEHLAGHLDLSNRHVCKVLDAAFDVEMSFRTNIFARIHSCMQLRGLYLDFDLVLQVGGEGDAAAAQHHDCDERPRNERFHERSSYGGTRFERTVAAQKPASTDPRSERDSNIRPPTIAVKPRDPGRK